MFLYKHEKADIEPRYIIDLRKAKISKGALPTGMNYFSITTADLDIKIQLKDPTEHEQWN